MMKELVIKLFLLINLVGCQKMELTLEPESIGANSDFFQYIITEGWAASSEYAANHTRHNEYILVEYGSVNFKNYNYIKIDITDKKILSSSHVTKNIIDDELNVIMDKLSGLTIDNNIYDGSAMLKDGNIYILTYYNKNKVKYKLGSYGLYLDNNYRDEKTFKIATFNVDLIKYMLSLI